MSEQTLAFGYPPKSDRHFEGSCTNVGEVITPKCIMRCMFISPMAKLLYVAVTSYMPRYESHPLSISRLALELDIKNTDVRKYFKELSDLHLLAYKRKDANGEWEYDIEPEGDSDPFEYAPLSTSMSVHLVHSEMLYEMVKGVEGGHIALKRYMVSDMPKEIHDSCIEVKDLMKKRNQIKSMVDYCIAYKPPQA